MNNIETAPSMEYVEFLRGVDPILNPIELGKVAPAYSEFKPWNTAYGMWASLDSMMRLTRGIWQFDKVLMLISGPAAGGKDAAREKMEEIKPGFSFKAVTATSRPARKGEAYGVDYYFYDSPQSFQKDIEAGNFLEWIAQGDRYYGMPKQSLKDALHRDEPVITSHVEMFSGWPAVDRYINSGELGLRVFPLKVFVLPNMRFSEYADHWLPSRRDDVETRLMRAASEILLAANSADLIITNTISENPKTLEWQTMALVDRAISLLDPETHNFRQFGTPFAVSPGISGKHGDEGILEYHRAMVNSG